MPIKIVTQYELAFLFSIVLFLLSLHNMDSALPTIDKYYVTKADAVVDSIYCHHDLMGELLVPEHPHDKAQFLYTEGDVVFVTTATKSYFLPSRHFREGETRPQRFA